MEQTLLTDQDNGLVYADAGASDRAWFAALADRANVDLETAGFPPVPRRPHARRAHGDALGVDARLVRAVDAPDPHAAALLLDLRPVAGGLEIGAARGGARRAARATSASCAFLVRDALELRAPAVDLGAAAGRSVDVDLKWQGIPPVVFLARCYAAEVGATERPTLARLEAAVRAGLMDGDLFAAVAGAYRFLLGLRLRVQLGRLARGAPATNEVPLAELSAIERERLKDAFRAIRAWQDKAAYHYRWTLLMAAIAADPAAFLRADPAVRRAPRAALRRGRAARSTSATAAARVAHRAAPAASRSRISVVVRKGAVRLERGGQTLQVLEEGETFGYTSLITARRRPSTSSVEEDLVAYRLPAESSAAPRRRAVRAPLRGRARRAAPRRASRRPPVAPLPGRPLARGRAARRAGPPFGSTRTRPSATRRASCASERDLVGARPQRAARHRHRPRLPQPRARRGARARDAASPQVVSRAAPDASRAGTPVYEAWAALLDAGVHHLPVVRGGEIVGVLTSTRPPPLLGAGADRGAPRGRAARRRATRSPGYARRVDRHGLGARRRRPRRVRRSRRSSRGSATRSSAGSSRSAEADLGPPPAPYAWLALGSEGRMEQTLLTDQDNALVYADEGAAPRGWFAALARARERRPRGGRVPALPGRLHGARLARDRLDEWRARFVGLDRRAVAARRCSTPPSSSTSGAWPGRSTSRRSRRSAPPPAKTPAFLRFLARAALEFKPPPPLLLRLRGEAPRST